jgi:hypothetical protein
MVGLYACIGHDDHLVCSMCFFCYDRLNKVFGRKPEPESSLFCGIRDGLIIVL